MSVEATSALTFRQLILEVARAMGTAYYGENGDGEIEIPVDPHDLGECKRHVNNGIRMFLSDAPRTGWRWARPVADVSLWPSVAIVTANTVSGGSYDSAVDETTLTTTADTFYESMEEHDIVVTTTGTFVMKRYISATQMTVYGDAHEATAYTYEITASGNYTLPRTFAGAYTGAITFGPATNRAVSIGWTDESTIRSLRENVNVNTGIPRYAAIDVFDPNAARRRYTLAVYPIPFELHIVQFPYDLHFDLLLDLDEVPPTPIAHDETIRAATLAVVERDVNGEEGSSVSYYRQSALPNSKNIDARTGPRKLGYFGNQRNIVTPHNARDFIKRPDVTYNT